MFGVSRFRTIVIYGRKEQLGQQLDMNIVYLKHMPNEEVNLLTFLRKYR